MFNKKEGGVGTGAITFPDVDGSNSSKSQKENNNDMVEFEP